MRRLAERRRQRSISAGRPRISQRSRHPAAGRVKSQWFCRFASSTSTRSGFCRYWLEKLPEGRSPGENVGRRVRARRHRSDRGSGLRAPTPAAIPIAPLQSSTSSSATSASTRRIAHPSILCGHESKVTVLRERLAEVSGDRAQIASAMAFPTSSVRAAPPMSGVWGPKARIFSMAAKTALPASGCPR